MIRACHERSPAELLPLRRVAGGAAGEIVGGTCETTATMGFAFVFLDSSLLLNTIGGWQQ
jgi:hypothetical protein